MGTRWTSEGERGQLHPSDDIGELGDVTIKDRPGRSLVPFQPLHSALNRTNPREKLWLKSSNAVTAPHNTNPMKMLWKSESSINSATNIPWAQKGRSISYSEYGGLKVKVSVTQSCPILCNPIDCSPPGSCPWGFPGKNTGMGSHSLLQGIFPTQGSDLGFLHFRQTLYHLSHQGSPLRVSSVKQLGGKVTKVSKENPCSEKNWKSKKCKITTTQSDECWRKDV